MDTTSNNTKMFSSAYNPSLRFPPDHPHKTSASLWRTSLLRNATSQYQVGIYIDKIATFGISLSIDDSVEYNHMTMVKTAS